MSWSQLLFNNRTTSSDLCWIQLVLSTASMNTLTKLQQCDNVVTEGWLKADFYLMPYANTTVCELRVSTPISYTEHCSPDRVAAFAQSGLLGIWVRD